jgi:hypothetical protein
VAVIEPETYDVLYGNVFDIRRNQYTILSDDSEMYSLIAGNTIYEISKRKKPGDFLLLFGGFWHKRIADAHKDMIVVEPAIGYPSSFCNYKVYPSYACLHSFVQDGNLQMNSYHVVIPHYFDVDDFDATQPKEDYFLFVGRLNFDKGITLAIQLTAQIGARLKVCGQGNLSSLGYDKIPEHVDFIGYVGVEERKKLMAKAKCLIMPTLYMEPFGCVAIEGMLSGTPILTNDWGGPGENNVHGVTGFKCRTFEQFEWAARNIHLINPKNCREWAEKNFSFDKIGHMYEEYFQSLQGIDWYKQNPSRTNLDHLTKHYPTSSAGGKANSIDLLPKDAEVGPAYCNRCGKDRQPVHPYSIVVAKFNENIEWTKELGDNVVIYDKSVPPLKNIGREAETFLRYIIEHYNNLPEYVIFLQGNPYDTMWSYTSVKDGLQPPDTACPFVAPWREDPINIWPETYYYRDYYFLLFGEHYTESTIRFSTGAQWSVPRNCITHRPLDFYKKLHRMISKAGNPTYEDVCARNYDKYSIDAWMLERLWAPIFNIHVPTSREFIVTREIPYNLFQTFKTKDISPALQTFVDTWKEKNPEYTYKFYDDDMCDKFMKEFDVRTWKAYQRIIPGAFKADLWRYCVLYKYGGIYADIDTMCLGKIDDFLSEKTEFVTPIDLDDKLLYNAFIAAAPGSKILKACIDTIVHNVENNIVPEDKIYFSACGVLANCTNEFLGRDKQSSFAGQVGWHDTTHLLKFEPVNQHVKDEKGKVLLQNKEKHHELYSLYTSECRDLNMIPWFYCKDILREDTYVST